MVVLQPLKRIIYTDGNKADKDREIYRRQRSAGD